MTMRVSQIAAWCECETYALQSPPRQAGRTNIAAHVGTMAHAMIADLPVPEPEGRLAFDYLTPTERAATIQATAIARYARQLMVNQGYGVLAREEEYITEELTGHLDIRAWHSEHGEAIIDLKTGNGIGAALACRWAATYPCHARRESTSRCRWAACCTCRAWRIEQGR